MKQEEAHVPIISETKVTGAPVLTHAEAQQALHELLQNDSRTKQYWHQRDRSECLIGPHPFDLDTTVKSSAPQLDAGVRLIAWPGYTEESVEAMKIMLAHHVPHPAVVGDTFRLRIVRIRKPVNHWNDPGWPLHNLFFELITHVGTFMCGGCNDYSGQGGQGGRQLTSIFRFVAALYDIELEEVVFSEADTYRSVKKLEDTYSDRMRTRAKA